MCDERGKVEKSNCCVSNRWVLKANEGGKKKPDKPDSKSLNKKTEDQEHFNKDTGIRKTYRTNFKLFLNIQI